MANTPAGFVPVAQTDTFDPASDINRAELFAEQYISADSPDAAHLPTLFPSPLKGERRWVEAENCGYVWNGTEWAADGTSDTGWVNETYATGWKDYSPGTYGTFAARRRGTLVSLRGVPIAGSGATSTVATLDTPFRPPFNVQFVVVLGSGVSSITIDSAGAVVIGGSFAGTTIALGQINYYAD